MANYDAALKYYNYGLEESQKSEYTHGVASGYNNIAMIYQLRGDYNNAIDNYEKALELSIELGFPESILVSYLNIALVYSSWYKIERSLEYINNAEEIADKNNLMKYKPYIYNLKGNLYSAFGKYDKSLEFYSNAKSLYEKFNDLNNLIIIQTNIGDVYLAWGKADISINYYRESLKLSKQINYNIYTSYIYNNIGRCYQFKHDFKEAINYYEKSLENAISLNRQDDIARAYNSLGMAYFQWWKFDKAAEYYNKAYEILKTINRGGDLAQVLIHLGGVKHVAGEYEASIEYYKKALEITEKAQNKTDSAIAYDNTGSIYLLLKDYKNAIKYYQKAVSLKEELRKTAIGSVRRDYLSSQINTYQRLVYAYFLNWDYNSAIDALEMSKTKFLVEKMSEKINHKVFSFNGVKNIQKSLDKDTSIVIYTNTNFINPLIFVIDNEKIFAVELNVEDLSKAMQSEEFKLFVKSDENTRGLKRKIDKVENEIDFSNNTLENSINYYRQLIAKPFSATLIEARAELISNKLYNFLLGKVEEKIKNKKNLLIIPDGILGYLPFEVLKLKDNKYLIEKYNISYAQSLSVQELLKNRNYNNKRKSIIAFGGAVYDSPKETIDAITNERELEYLISEVFNKIENTRNLKKEYLRLGLAKWLNLPGTLKEVKEIKKIFTDADVLTGVSVSEPTVKQFSDDGKLKNYKVIHFSTHGIVIPVIPELSALVLSQNSDLTDDGFLNMKEISELNINADFVNLSACETGLGKIYGGEGVVGLTQSFLMAGANALSVSLWQVADESTMEFMKGLYALAKKNNLDYYYALNEMKRKFIKDKKYSDPFYWAPFVYYGR